MMGPSDVRTVTVVGAGGALRDAARAILAQNEIDFSSLEVAEIGAGHAFFAPPGCILLDLEPPGRSGSAHIEALRDSGCALPIVCLTEWTDVRSAVDLMKAGAFEVLESPLNGEKLVAVLDRAAEASLRDSGANVVSAQLAARLSTREAMVLERLLRGETNKMVAVGLGISIRTVEFHRGNIYRKLSVNSLAELIALNA